VSLQGQAAADSGHALRQQQAAAAHAAERGRRRCTADAATSEAAMRAAADLRSRLRAEQARAAASDRTLAAQSAERVTAAVSSAVPSGSQQCSPGAQVRDTEALEERCQIGPQLRPAGLMLPPASALQHAERQCSCIDWQWQLDVRRWKLRSKLV